MSEVGEYGTLPVPWPRPAAASPGLFGAYRAGVDQRVLAVFESPQLGRDLGRQSRVQLDQIWTRLRDVLSAKPSRTRRRAAPALESQLAVHERLVSGLPGEALFISSAMAFDSMEEALPFFELSAKTARARLGERLSTSESEMALRLGRVLGIAAEVFGSPEAGRAYLRTPNFALGGVLPRDLLRTAGGEQIVLAELQAQAEGGPV